MTSATRPDAILDVSECVIEYETPRGIVRSLDSATLRVPVGQLTAVVGESGSGKSTLGMASGRLLASNARVVSGSLTVAGIDVVTATAGQVRELRRETLAFIFQNPIASLDPTMRVGRQLKLASRPGREDESIEDSLRSVGLEDAARVLSAFPHELSGGMAQRVCIAMALRRRPRLLVADEPTASVDATRRDQILDLLVERCQVAQCALLLLTHDLRAVARHTTHMAVMYAGRIVESGPTSSVLANPLHPYTRALVESLPGDERPGERLEPIGGVPPVLTGASPGCAFADRCPSVIEVCTRRRPVYAGVDGFDGRAACCHLVTPSADGDADSTDAQEHQAEHTSQPVHAARPNTWREPIGPAAAARFGESR
jgi:peptide/nickel transport system ATP-binding protein